MRTANYLAGVWQEQGEALHTVRDAYTGAVIAEVSLADASAMDKAIASAADARSTLEALGAEERAARLEHLAATLFDRSEEFAQLIRREAGKPITYARTEVARAITTVKLAAAAGLQLQDEEIDVDYDAGRGRRAWVRRVPVGVVAAITPFNFPLNLVLHKVAPALAMGCPVVLKPAPQTPLTALLLAELIDALRFPAGSFSTVPCNTGVAEQLVKDERVALLSFTGSDSVGWRLKEICGRKRVALELGGNAAVIVDEGTDLASAATLIAQGAFAYAGQTCISTQRIYVVEPLFAAFRDALLEATQHIVSGDPARAEVHNGPLIDAHHCARIARWVEEAQQAGATVLCGGQVLDPAHNVYAPTLLTGTRPSMRINADEAFGPVAVVEPARDFDDALQLVNASRFGLQAGLFSTNEHHIQRAFAELEVGGLIINGAPGLRVDGMPYGGVKHSGLGREGPRYTMDEMSERRVLLR
ncbi:MAG: aldehyde dehydrogenase family protein [Flavobacteriales bacterium]